MWQRFEEKRRELAAIGQPKLMQETKDEVKRGVKKSRNQKFSQFPILIKDLFVLHLLRFPI